MAGIGPDGRPAGGFAELLQAAIEGLRNGDAKGARDTLLFLGQRHQAFPAIIVSDPVLEPVDKIVWMTLWQSGGAGLMQATFPSYAEIAANAHVRSKSTVARALAILRATRWISLCASVRGRGGKFRNNVYAVHDEPQTLAIAMALDPTYMKFLEAAREHAYPRVRVVVRAVLTAIDEDIDAQVDVVAPVNVINQRLQALKAVSAPGEHRYFGFSPRRVAAIDAESRPEEGTDRVQILDSADQVQYLDSVNSSSSSNNKTTTTATTSEKPQDAPEPALVFPRGLTENQRTLAVHYLRRVPTTMRQAVLDELDGRVRAANHGAKPLYDPVRYLHRLCVEVEEGRFVVNLGEAILAERTRRRRPQPSPAEAENLAPSAPKTASEKSPVDAIRSQFSLPTRLKEDELPTGSKLNVNS